MSVAFEMTNHIHQVLQSPWPSNRTVFSDVTNKNDWEIRFFSYPNQICCNFTNLRGHSCRAVYFTGENGLHGVNNQKIGF